MWNSSAYRLERAIIPVVNRIEAFGFPMNEAAGHALLATLTEASAANAETLFIAFPPKHVPDYFTPKRDNKKRGYLAGVPYDRGKIKPFNPSSPQQIVERLTQDFGIQLTEMTDDNRPSTKASVLATLVDQHPAIAPLLTHKVLEKRIGMLDGYLTAVAQPHDEAPPDHRLHTQYRTLGAITGRCTHQPNIAQVPSVQRAKDGTALRGAAGNYGYEFRDLFHAPPGWGLVGADMSGLELRCQAHYLDRIGCDNGAFTRLVTTGDPHQEIADRLGITRAMGKRLIYAANYGCGDKKAGTIVAPDEDNERVLCHLGADVKRQLIANIAGMHTLFRWLDKQRDRVPGLDGRWLRVRKQHAALNTLLQSAGAIICKQWLVTTDADLQASGLQPGMDYEFTAFVHDEMVIAVRDPATATIVAAAACAAAPKVEAAYQLACPLKAEARTGQTWAEIH